MELKLIKENMWKKWRKRMENNMPRGKDEAEFAKSDLKGKLEKLERIKEKMSIEKSDREEKLRRDKERKRAWRNEGK